MKSHKLWAAAAAALVTASASASLAQTFPADAAWVPITRGGVVLGDPTGDAQNERDIVGDENNPAAFVYGDAAYLYFRLRIAATPLQSAATYKPFGWGVEFDTDANPNSYEFLAMLDGITNPDAVTLQQNTTQATSGSPKDPAEVLLQSWPPDTHAQAKEAGTALGGGTDWFVSWAIERAPLVAAGVDFSQPIRFIFGSSNNAQTLLADLLSPSGATTIPELGSDPVSCEGNECENCGTGTCASGCSSDADCKDPALPACQPSGQCGECSASNVTRCTGATPTCDVASGTCITTCTSDADCKNPSLPACQPDGRCAECSSTNKSRCTGNQVCDTDNGLCTAQCTTDADCKNPALPVCRGDGVCVQCGVANSSQCKEPTPVCNTVLGDCVARCTTDADCKDPDRPACNAAGACTQCSATNKARCTGATPMCFVGAGVCVGSCTSDAQCLDPLWPACGADGFCWQCSASNVTRCNVSAPVCDAARGLCASVPPEPGATFDGSGLTCATSHSERAAGVSLLLFGAGVLALLRLRRSSRRR